MKISIDIGEGIGVHVQVHPYSGKITEPLKWGGARATVAYCSNLSNPEIELDGNVERVRELLVTAVEQLDMLVKNYKNDAEHAVKANVRCDVCGCYYDSRRPREWGHADDRGHTCLGDGTILLGDLKVEVPPLSKLGDVAVEGAWFDLPGGVLSLKAQDRFRLTTFPRAKGEYPESFTAIGDGFYHYDGYSTHAAVRVKRPESWKATS